MRRVRTWNPSFRASSDLRGFQVTAAAEPTEQVHVAAGQVVYLGPPP